MLLTKDSSRKVVERELSDGLWRTELVDGRTRRIAVRDCRRRIECVRRSCRSDGLTYCRPRVPPLSRECDRGVVDGRPWRIAIRRPWATASCHGFLLLYGPLLCRRCDVCRWTSSTSFGLETTSLCWRRRSSRCRDAAFLTWSNVRSSTSVSSRGRTKIPEHVHVSKFTYYLFYIFHFSRFSPFGNFVA